jgi:hypothetical protein
LKPIIAALAGASLLVAALPAAAQHAGGGHAGGGIGGGGMHGGGHGYAGGMHHAGFSGRPGYDRYNAGFRGRGYGGYPYALGAFGLGWGLGAYDDWYDGAPYSEEDDVDDYASAPVAMAPPPQPVPAPAPTPGFCGWTWNQATQLYDRTPC